MKKLTCLFLTVVFGFLLSANVFTSEGAVIGESPSKRQQIIELISQLTDHNLEKARQGIQTDTLDATEISIESQLEALGVEVMDTAALRTFMARRGMVPLVTVPEDTTNVRWYSFTETKTVSGVTYEVQHISATPRHVASNLTLHSSWVPLFQNQNFIINEINEFLNVYIQKGIGLIPVIGWLPYEFLFQNTSFVSDSDIKYNGFPSTSFSFVKEAGQSDFYQTQALTSNYVKAEVFLHISSVVNESFKNQEQSFNIDEYDEAFINTDMAITAYRQGSHVTSFYDGIVLKFAYKGSSPQYTYTLDVPTVNYIGQVY